MPRSTKNGMDPTNKKDVTIFNQPFDMDLFLKRQVDAAAAMTYNELAQVLETKNPKTGKLYQLDRPERDQDGRTVGTGDARGRHLRRRGDWIKDKAHQAIAKNSWQRRSRAGSTAATTRGRASRSCSRTARTLGGATRRWQMNEINALDLAEHARDRDHGHGRVQPHGDDREDSSACIKKAPSRGVPDRPAPRRPSRS